MSPYAFGGFVSTLRPQVPGVRAATPSLTDDARGARVRNAPSPPGAGLGLKLDELIADWSRGFLDCEED